MKQIDSKFVVGVAFDSREDALLFEELLQARRRVAVLPHEFVYGISVSELPLNNIGGNVSGTAIQVHTVHGDIADGIAGKRVRD